ncbi:lipoate--protein ligase family protein [Actinomadura xylanilytica]|uniref:lipoate--protein ligase family protein n=1 Tax=Actinomadura xylanilytica TaxID=887459 RepID=UPI00255A806E|nr:biotin/lipoate A/B protein ligase family protein [Actinomadura xylanilytica]MDL4775159.1 biotin/lipoate A/B protein ligase family protein [Actinomadura xylanilytica]
MHGEYKVPGGKLVVADVDVVDGLLRSPRISGDFFLEPDEALEAINTALDGLPAGLEAREIAARVDAGLPPGTVMLGLSAEAVGITVRRAVARASDWHQHEWRLIHAGPQEPALHMALDQVLAEEVGAGRRPPTLRIWEWASPSIIIGSFQSLRNEVDAEAARRHGVTVVRRISGGGAMFVEPGNTITYSLYAPESLVAGMSFAESYAFLDDWVLGALGELGVKAWYQPLNDITSDQGKIGGAAQKRLASGAVLHHVTMSYDIDADKMLQVLRIGREKVSDKGITSAKKRVDPLRRQTGLPREEIIDRMIGHFRARHGLAADHLTDDETRLAEKYVTDKFDTEAWTARVP